MRFFKLLEIIALALLVFICIIGGDNSKNSNSSVPVAKSKFTASIAASTHNSR